jgi:uncharacterized SAM-binding protein YcdF (DUF218 family)
LSKIQKIALWTLASLCLAMVLVFVIKFDSILTSIGNFLIVNEQPQKADVIIVLGDGFDRVARGAELYQSGYADKVLLSGGNTNTNRIMKEQALSLGVPKSAILQEDQSRTTFENAKYSLKIVQAQGFKSAIVVTSPYHTRRSSIIFAQFFKGINLTMCSVPFDPAMTQNWWKDSYSTRFVFSEYLKLMWHYLFEWS